MNLRAGIPCSVSLGQGRNRLHGGESACRRVQTIAGDTGALFVGEVDDVLSGMKAIVAGAEAFCRLDPKWRIRGQPAVLRVEFELEYDVGTVIFLDGLQNVIVEA